MWALKILLALPEQILFKSCNLGSSPAEQAWNDSARIDDNLLKKFTVDEDGEIYNDDNMDFINGFLDKLGKNESAGLRDADGDPNKKCIERIQNAVFTKVYGSSMLTELQAESAKPKIRNVLKALNGCVGDFAQIKGHDDLDVVPDMMEAIEYTLAHQNQSKAELEHTLKNAGSLDFTGDTPKFKTEHSVDMILAISDRAGSRNRLENVFKAISNGIKDEVASRDNPEVDMFSGPAEPKSKEQVVKQALNKLKDDNVQKSLKAGLWLLRKSKETVKGYIKQTGKLVYNYERNWQPKWHKIKDGQHTTILPNGRWATVTKESEGVFSLHTHPKGVPPGEDGSHLHDYFQRSSAAKDHRWWLKQELVLHPIPTILERLQELSASQVIAIPVADNIPNTSQRKQEAIKKIASEFNSKYTEQNPLKNTSMDCRVQVSVGGLKHFKNFTGDAKKWALLTKIDDVLRDAIYLRSELLDPRKRNDVNKIAFHKLGLVAQVGNEPILAIIDVQEDSNGDWIYDAGVESIEIKEPVASKTGLAENGALDQLSAQQQAITTLAQQMLSHNDHLTKSLRSGLRLRKSKRLTDLCTIKTVHDNSFATKTKSNFKGTFVTFLQSVKNSSSFGNEMFIDKSIHNTLQKSKLSSDRVKTPQQNDVATFKTTGLHLLRKSNGGENGRTDRRREIQTQGGTLKKSTGSSGRDGQEGRREGDERKRLQVGAWLIKSRSLDGRIDFNGLPVSIETGKSRIRAWSDPHTGKNGMTLMRNPYGYIKGTLGQDGDAVDAYVGPHRDAENVYIINQKKGPDFVKHDEQKCMLGFRDEQEAREAYLRHYDDPRFLGSVITIPFEAFKEKIESGRYEPERLHQQLAITS